MSNPEKTRYYIITHKVRKGISLSSNGSLILTDLSLPPTPVKPQLCSPRYKSKVSKRSHEKAGCSTTLNMEIEALDVTRFRYEDTKKVKETTIKKGLSKSEPSLLNRTYEEPESLKFSVKKSTNEILAIIRHYTNLNEQRKQSHLVKLRKKQIEVFKKLFGLTGLTDEQMEKCFKVMEKKSTREIEEVLYGLNRGRKVAPGLKIYLEIRHQGKLLQDFIVKP